MSNPIGAFAIYGKLNADGSNAAIGVTPPTAASDVLSFIGNAVAGETVTITGALGGSQVYTWVASLANVTLPNQVLVAGTEANSIGNLAAAINKSAGQDGVKYSFNTAANPSVTAVAASTSLTVTAIASGGEGNTISVAEAMSNASWASSTLTGGTYGSFNVSDVGGGTGTYTTIGVPNSTTSAIPVTAKRWAVSFQGTGTANTFGSATNVSAGFSANDDAAPSAPIAIMTDGSSTAIIVYSTT